MLSLKVKYFIKIFQKSSLTVSVQFTFEPALYCLNLELDLRFSSIISLNFELNFEFGSKSSGSGLNFGSTNLGRHCLLFSFSASNSSNIIDCILSSALPSLSYDRARIH